jgi:hypothetical protein
MDSSREGSISDGKVKPRPIQMDLYMVRRMNLLEPSIENSSISTSKKQ